MVFLLSQGLTSESLHIRMALHVAVQIVFSKLWNAFFTILYLLTKGAGKNKDAQTKPPPFDTKVYIKKLERRIADLENMTKEMAQLDSTRKNGVAVQKIWRR